MNDYRASTRNRGCARSFARISSFFLSHWSRLQLTLRPVNPRRRLADPAGTVAHCRRSPGSVFSASVFCALALLSIPGSAAVTVTQSPLYAAVESSDYRRLLELLREPGVLDGPGPSGNTALHTAARKGSALMVALLLSYGADPQALNDAGELPVRVDPLTKNRRDSRNARRRAVLDAFIDHHVQQQPTGLARQAQLRFRVAAAIGDVDMARAALREGANPNAKTIPRGESVLHGFAHPELLAGFISMGADLEQRNARGRTPLRRALEERDADMVEAFLRAGAQPTEGRKPSDLQLAMRAPVEDRDKMMRALLAAGAQIRFLEWMVAVKGKKDDVVALFLRHGGPFDLQDPGVASLLKSALNGQGQHGGPETLGELRKDPSIRAALESRRREMDGQSRAVIKQVGGFAGGHLSAVFGLIVIFTLLACAPAMLLTRKLPAFTALVGLFTVVMTHLFVFTPVVSAGVANFRLLGTPLRDTGIDWIIYGLVYGVTLITATSLALLLGMLVPVQRRRALMLPGTSAFLVVVAVLALHHFSLIHWPTSVYLTVSGHTPRMEALESELEQKQEKKRQERAAAQATIPPPAHEPLFAAVNEGSLAGVEAALAGGVDIGVRDKEGRSALHRATELGNAKLIQPLVELGADVNARDDKGRSPLYIALSRSPVERIQETTTALLDAGADANLARTGGATPLCLLVRARGSYRNVLRRLLIEHGAHYRLSDSCLGAAYLADREGTRSWLEFDPVELDAWHSYHLPVSKDIYAAPALWHAARSHDKGKVKLLLAIGADPEARDTEFGRTPLQVAIDTSRTKDARDIAVVLLRGGADPHAVAWDGRTTNAFDRHGLIASIKPGELRKTRD